MDPKQLTYIKYGLASLFILGGFGLVLDNKLDAVEMYKQTATVLGALFVALGLTGAGSNIRAAMDHRSDAIAKATFNPGNPSNPVGHP